MKDIKMKSVNNIWNKDDLIMCSIGEKNKIKAKIRHIRRCIRWSWQRITRGYADCDTREMFYFLQNLMPEMLQEFKEDRTGSPGHLGENYYNEEGVLVNDTCHNEWNQILNQMIWLWRESNESTCGRVNPYEKEYTRALDEFEEKYGILGEKLQTEEELEENRQRGGGGTVHFMDELPEYKELCEKYMEAKYEISKYREECKDNAFELLKEYFFCLWY